jgi:hypothetical protein
MKYPTLTDPRAQRALRLGSGTALSLALGFGLALPMPFLAPMLTAILLASMPKALPAKAAIALPLLVMLTTGAGLLLTPLLTYAPLSGVLLVGLGLFLCLRLGQRGGNNLLVTFLVIGLTMISAAGSTSFELGLTVVEALAKGLLTAVLVTCVSHWIFPEADDWPAPQQPEMTVTDANWIALRGALVIMPSYLLALINPAGFMPLIMQSVNLGQQACGVSARDAGRELLGSTLLGGLLAILLWNLLGIFTHLWMFFLLTLLFSLLIARRIYGLRPGRRSASFWLSSLTTMLLLLGQSVQDSASGKDVMAAFIVRMGLFIAVTLYACTAVYLIDRHRNSRRILPVQS